MKKKGKFIFTSFMAVAMCASLIGGLTYAFFTSESITNIPVTSAKIDVSATVNFTAIDQSQSDEVIYDDASNTLTIKSAYTGDRVGFDVQIENQSNIAIKYRTKISSVGNDNYDFSKLSFLADGKGMIVAEDYAVTPWSAEPTSDIAAFAAGTEKVSVEIGFSSTRTEDIVLAISIDTVPGNTHVEDPAPVPETEKTPLSISEGYRAWSLYDGDHVERIHYLWEIYNEIGDDSTLRLYAFDVTDGDIDTDFTTEDAFAVYDFIGKGYQNWTDIEAAIHEAYKLLDSTARREKYTFVFAIQAIPGEETSKTHTESELYFAMKGGERETKEINLAQRQISDSIFDAGIYGGTTNFTLISGNIDSVNAWLAQFNGLIEGHEELTADNAENYLEILLQVVLDDDEDAVAFSKAVPFKNQGYSFNALMLDWAKEHFRNGGQDGATKAFKIYMTIQLKETVNGGANELLDYFTPSNRKLIDEKANDGMSCRSYTFTQDALTATSEAQIRFNEPGSYLEFFRVDGNGSVFTTYHAAYVELEFTLNGTEAYSAYFFAEENRLKLYSNEENSGEPLDCEELGNAFKTTGEFNTWIRNNYNITDFDARNGWKFRTKVYVDENSLWLFEGAWSEYIQAPGQFAGIATQFTATYAGLENCQLENSNDATDGYFIGGIQGGGVIKFTINSTVEGIFELYLAAGSEAFIENAFDVYVNGVKEAAINNVHTDGWTVFTEFSAGCVQLRSGLNTIEFRATTSVNGNVNVDYLAILPIYSGTRLQGEESHASLQGDCNVQPNDAALNGYFIGDITNGSAITYQIYSAVEERVELRLSAAGQDDYGNAFSKAFEIYVNGAYVADLDVGTGGWTNFTELFVACVSLKAGQVNTIEFRAVNTNGQVNVDYLAILPIYSGSEMQVGAGGAAVTGGCNVQNNGSGWDGHIVGNIGSENEITLKFYSEYATTVNLSVYVDGPDIVSFEVILNGNSLGTCSAQAGAWLSFVEVSAGSGTLHDGENTIVIRSITGGFNFNYVKISPAD